jgi:Tol biopolymer transport system component
VHVITRGQDVDSASFSPSGGQVVYSSFGLPNPGGACPNLFVANADGSGVHALTRDGRSDSPLWGPRQIAFARSTSCIGPAPPPAQLWLVNPDGHGAHQLTHKHFATHSPGLTPIAWSDDGRRLLAERLASDAAVSSAWAIDVPRGRARALTSRRQNALAFGLSHDGNTVLATLGPLDYPPDETIATIPWQGGHPHVLVRHAGTPSWNK